MLMSRAVIGLLSLMVAAAGDCRADAYRFDSLHTVASFRCGPFGVGAQAGHVTGAHGELVFDPDHPGDSLVDVTLDMTTLHTDWRAFDGQARGADFLDVVHYPTATFKSRRVEVTGEGTANVTGDLTLHGETHEVTMMVSIRRAKGNSALLGFSALARIRRSDFGVDHPAPLLNDTIDLRIEAQAAPASQGFPSSTR